MQKIKILIVDDDPDLRDSTADLLRTIMDAEVSEASNGHVALDHIMRNVTDAVVIDLNMPIMSGMRLVELLKRQGFPTSKILVYSATLDQGRVLRLAKMEVEHFFVKPVDPTPFLARIRQVVGCVG